ncbi:bifunctional helix-turn-helix transcriptional regulator/GNAT family N-acetyltransferase [Streptomyces sp. MMG1121]|uniref:bifunctional helix-turn-helix transcriptional regulator/GNAT family N-acetyltransferase n=1 Tax=Streptomyces sp. MMG1121 TaxID=1415544 RepID=UPI00099C5F72|nr:bifunctional helix-turn-helix transcriptional regulator/GNAT family N-acetyltransferase [Streptomyces sp. MMG1121]
MTVQDVRAFHRFATVLHELAHTTGADPAGPRAGLGLEDGHLNRVLDAFEEAGLVERTPLAARPALTGRGRAAAALLDTQARESAGALLEAVGPVERTRLEQALRTIRTTLGDAPATTDPAEVVLREPRPGDLGWIVQRNAALYAAEHGWNADYEGLVARIVADFAEDHDPHLERVWIAESAGRPVGCVMCVRDDAPGAARLRLLLVEPAARGLGIGDRLVGAVVDFARGVGYRDLVLWTNDVLGAARRLYRRHGFVLTAEKPHRSFGKDLTGQDWRLDLHRSGE